MRTRYFPLTLLLLAAAGLASCSRFTSKNATAQPLVRTSAAVHAMDALDLSIADRYPLTHNDIQQMILHGNEDEMREHGWVTLANLVSDDGTPRQDGNSSYEAAWDSATTPWADKCALGLGGKSPNCKALPTRNSTDCRLVAPNQSPNKTKLETPIQQVDAASESRELLPRVPQLPVSETPPIAFISTVRYNPQAASVIREHCLYLSEGTIGGQQVGIKNFVDSVDQFDPASVIVKLIWAVPDKNGHIHVWNPALAINHTNTGSPDSWPFVTVDTNSTSACNADQYPAFKPNTKDDPPSAEVKVPIGCFYHRQYACTLLDNDIRPSTTGSIYHCPRTQQFQAILMGVHVITAEQHDWVWNTYWWTPDPNNDPGHRNQIDAVAQRGPWRFFAMNVAMSPNTPPDVGGKPPHIAFNPYLEGPAENSTVSNCMYCHKKAVIYSDGSRSVISELAKGSPPSCAYMTPWPTDCSAPPANYDAPYEVGAIPTHFLWSLSDNLDSVRAFRQSLNQHNRRNRNK